MVLFWFVTKGGLSKTCSVKSIEDNETKMEIREEETLESEELIIEDTDLGMDLIYWKLTW